MPTLNASCDIFGAPGFSTDFCLTPDELAFIRQAVRAQWLRRIKKLAPQHVHVFAELPIERYHECSHLIDHKLAWPKAERLFAPSIVSALRGGPFIRSLESSFGPFAISNEECLLPEEIYWRLVRPNCAGDVGSIHADAWFWELGHGKPIVNQTRVKVWVALHCESGKNGFRLVRGSHRSNWPYSGERRDGFIKPVIGVDESELNPELVNSAPGQAIVFHDRLLHGGAPGGDTTRVSFEFTMLLDAQISAA